ncbi:hypothetical protein NPIL_32821 [Nephila pilipes]|uniref:Uncharacterized protein n=1 Tax=Nephila pilipes TaxID=299642 RepID=A0A8X6N9P7_NEPPI|nr:hypothetical protein NPIL_32821 [Nephila pilipes]
MATNHSPDPQTRSRWKKGIRERCSRETKETGLRVVGVAKDGGESRFSNSGRESAGGEESRREKGGRNGQKRKNQLLSPHVCFLRWRVLRSWVLCCVVFRCGKSSALRQTISGSVRFADIP